MKNVSFVSQYLLIITVIYKHVLLINRVTEDEYAQTECFDQPTIFTGGAVISSRTLTRETVLYVYTRAIVLTRARKTFVDVCN